MESRKIGVTIMLQSAQENIVKLQPKGLLTIPKRFREELGFEENSLVRVRKEKGRIILEPIRTLPYPVRSYTKQNLEEFIDFDQEETRELKKKRLL